MIDHYIGCIALALVLLDWTVRFVLWRRKQRLPNLSAYDVGERRLDELHQFSEDDGEE